MRAMNQVIWVLINRRTQVVRVSRREHSQHRTGIHSKWWVRRSKAMLITAELELLILHWGIPLKALRTLIHLRLMECSRIMERTIIECMEEIVEEIKLLINIHSLLRVVHRKLKLHHLWLIYKHHSLNQVLSNRFNSHPSLRRESLHLQHCNSVTKSKEKCLQTSSSRLSQQIQE
jgi:hypothetical protein